MKWLMVVVIIIHGLIHLLGAVNELGLAKVEGFSNKTLFLIPHNIPYIWRALVHRCCSVFNCCLRFSY